VTLGQFLTGLGAIAAVKVLTRVLTPKDYGTLALALTLTALSQYLFFVPISVGPSRFFVAAREQHQLGSFLRAVRSLVVKSSQAFWLFVAVASGIVWVIGGVAWAEFVLLIALFAFGTGIGALLDGLQGAARQRVVVALHSGVGQWLRLGVALLAIRLLGSSAGSVLLGFAVGVALVLVSQYYFFRRRLLPDQATGNDGGVGRDWRAHFVHFGFPFALFGPAQWLQSGADRWAVEGFVNRAAVGYYAAAYQIGYQPLLLLSNVVLQVIGPITYQWAGEGVDPSRLRRAHSLITRVVLIGLAGTAVAAYLTFAFKDEIFSLLVDQRYRSASGLIPWFVLSAGLFTCGQAASLYQLSAGDARSLIAPKVVTALVGAALNVVGAATFGVIGVAWAGVIFSASYFLWMMLGAGTMGRLVHRRRMSAADNMEHRSVGLEEAIELQTGDTGAVIETVPARH
jgi:O-antigen/teichoic acid export membrane protein